MAVRGDDETVAGTLQGAGGPATDGAGEKIDIAALIARRYKIVRWLGGGGMGRVYEAFDTELEERIALKVLRGGLTNDALERFRREVRLTRKIQHRNVARMFDIGDHDGEKFLTMELVDGEALTRLVGGPLAWARLRTAALQIGGGLAAAHALGVIHRDLKPDNILVELATGRFVITDFGIARGGDDPTVTMIGAIVGTPRYMAPEQLAGRDLDARADLFSLGVMLYELATGTRPWAGDNAIAMAVAQATIAPRPFNAAVPAAFAALVMRCIAIDPTARPESAAALVAEIERDTDAPDTQTGRTPKFTLPPSRPTPSPTATATIANTETSLAVLPITCAPGDEYLADGIHEDLIDTLSTTAGVRVRPAGLVRGVADPDVRELGRKLEVDHVIAGSLRRTPTGLRVSARLISVADGFQIWAHKADCVETDVLALADQLAHGIATALSTRASVATRPTDPRAVDLYLRARAELRRFWGGHARAASDLLEEAASYAPTSAPILGALAYASVQAWVVLGEPEFEARALRAIERGLVHGHGEAHLASAMYRVNSGDVVGGAAELGIALARAPMSAQTHEYTGKILVELGAIDAARHHLATAVGLDPGRALIITADLARLDALMGDLDGAREKIALLTTNPDPSLQQVGMVFTARIATWYGDSGPMRRTSQNLAARFGPNAVQIHELLFASADGAAIDRTEWARVLDRFVTERRPKRIHVLAMQLMAESAFTTGEDDLGISLLERATDIGLMDIVWLDRCPLFNRLRSDPGWSAVRQRVAVRAASILDALQAATRA